MTNTILPARTFNPIAVSAGDLSSIQNASSRDKIGHLVTRILDQIADWFCGTKRTEIKKCLFDLYSPASTDQQKIKSFLALQEMAAEGYKNRFCVSRENGQERYVMELDSAQTESHFSLSREIVHCDKNRILAELRANRKDEDLQKVLEKDINRGSYLVNGVVLEGDQASRLAQLENELNALNCTPQEKKAITELSNQSIFGIVMESSQALDSTGNPTGFPKNCPAPNEGTLTEFQISRENGLVRVRARSYQDVALVLDANDRNQLIKVVQDDYFQQKSIDINIDLSVSTQGHKNIIALNYLTNSGTSV